jgi:hypothetical protein
MALTPIFALRSTVILSEAKNLLFNVGGARQSRFFASLRMTPRYAPVFPTRLPLPTPSARVYHIPQEQRGRPSRAPIRARPPEAGMPRNIVFLFIVAGLFCAGLMQMFGVNYQLPARLTIPSCST